MKNYLLIILLCFFFVGCTLFVPKGDYFSRETIPPLNEEMATIFVYRTGAYSSGMEHGIVNIFINDDIIFGAVHKGYTWFYLKPGKYEFRAMWTVATKPLFEGGLFDEKKLDLTVEKGKRYFVTYQVWDFSEKSAYSDFGLIGKMLEPKRKNVEVNFKEESEEQGMSDLQACRFQKNNFDQIK